MSTEQSRAERRIYVCTTFREFNGDANAEIQNRFLDSLEAQTFRNWELVATTFGETTVEPTLAARTFDSRVIDAGRPSGYRYSLTDVVVNGIRALEETGGILLWTTADVIFSPSFLREVDARCGSDTAGLSHPHDVYSSLADYAAGRPADPPTLGDGIDFLFFDDNVLLRNGGKEIIERYRFVEWGIFEHFLVGVANACARERVNLWPAERVAKIDNDRVAAREDDAFFETSHRRNLAVCEQFVAAHHQSELLRSLRFCSLCFESVDRARFLETFGSEIWQFFIGGGTNHRVPDEWPRFLHEFVESRDNGAFRLEPGEPVSLSELADFRGFGLGWAHPDSVGVWTQGNRSSLTLRIGRSLTRRRRLALTMADACVEPDAVLTVDAAIDGRGVGTRTFSQVDPDPVWRIELPRRSSVEVTLAVRDPRSPRVLGWSDDDRALGVRLRAMHLELEEGRVTPRVRRIVARLAARRR